MNYREGKINKESKQWEVLARRTQPNLSSICDSAPFDADPPVLPLRNSRSGRVCIHLFHIFHMSFLQKNVFCCQVCFSGSSEEISTDPSKQDSNTHSSERGDMELVSIKLDIPTTY